MLLKHETIATTTGATMPTATACGNCGLDERRLLHHVRHRGIFRRLCTTCVLRLHPQSFCPTCFAVYRPSPPPSAPNDAVTCFKCYSASHSSCVGPNPPNPYICPICITPNTPIFVLKKAKDSSASGGTYGKAVDNENCRVIDKKAAKILLAAATVAEASMNKAAIAARGEAERRAKEAAFARKRARQALEHLMILGAKEKLKNQDHLTSFMSRDGGSIGGASLDRKDSSSNVRVGNLSSGIVAAGGLQERHRVGNVDRTNLSSNSVLSALNAVELREKEKLGGLKPNSSVVPRPFPINGVAMDVEENGGTKIVSSPNAGDSSIKNHGGGNGNVSVRSGNLAYLQTQNRQREKASNGTLPHPAKEDKMQGVESSEAGGKDCNGAQQ